MIKHYCDGCSKEVKRYATIVVAPKWFTANLGAASFKFELCDACYLMLREVIRGVPENTVKEEIV